MSLVSFPRIQSQSGNYSVPVLRDLLLVILHRLIGAHVMLVRRQPNKVDGNV